MLFFVLPFLLLFLLIEVGLHFFFPVRLYLMEASSTMVKELGWGPRTRADQAVNQEDSPHRHCDTLHEFAKKDDRIRVLLLGDSNLDCDEEHPYPTTLPAKIQNALGPTYEVINLSAGGWGNDQQYLAYRRIGQRYDPDIVLLFFTPSNDLYNNASKKAIFDSWAKPKFELQDDGTLSLQKPPRPNEVSVFYRWASLFQIGRRLLLLKQKIATGNTTDANFASERYSHVSSFLTPLPSRIQQSWEVTKLIFKKLNSDIKSKGSHFGIVYLPVGMRLGQLCGGPQRCVGYVPYPIHKKCGDTTLTMNIHQPFELLSQLSKETGIPLIHNLPKMKRFQHQHRRITQDCVHLTQLGQTKLVPTIVQAIQDARKKLIPTLLGDNA